ncbi:MAG: helix-turn-helix domain-containing protein [Deltaproteobacteria bacterium]|nr:helix-turn-helix domain-containing protein [Deltaproteobacteria bacterium]
MSSLGTNGILNPQGGAANFALSRVAPAEDLAQLVERYWLVRWDLRGRPGYAQETLSYPCVNLVIGTHRPGVFGPVTRRFTAELAGLGWVVGAKFRPGAFAAFSDAPAIALVDQSRQLGELFGPAGYALTRAVHDELDDPARIAHVEAFLRAHRRPIARDAIEVARVVGLAEAEPAIARAADLADRAGLPLRALERLFRRHVGLPPKTVIRRFRVQEAAARVAAGAAITWTELAHELGYCDQAHFIREFKAQLGRTPTQYAAWCAASQGGVASAPTSTPSFAASARVAAADPQRT